VNFDIVNRFYVQEFKWTLPTCKSINGEMDNSPIDKRQLVILVYDKDQFSSDDVLGSVIIQLSDLTLDTELDRWLPIVQPMTARRWSWRNVLQSRLKGQQPQAELKVKVMAREVGSHPAVVANEISEVGSWCVPGNAAVEATSLKGSAKLLPVAGES
jgi:hypothetical protein